MKITVFEFFNENREQYKQLVKAGAVSWLLERNMELFEYYNKQYKETGSKMLASSITSERFKVSERTVGYVVEKMNKEITQI